MSFPRKSQSGIKWSPVEVEKASTVNSEISKEIENLAIKYLKKPKIKQTSQPQKSHDTQNSEEPIISDQSQQTPPVRKFTALERQLKMAILTEKIRRLKANTNLLKNSPTNIPTNNTKTTSKTDSKTKVTVNANTNIKSPFIKVRNAGGFNADEKYPFPKTDTLAEVKDAEARQRSPGRNRGVAASDKVHKDSDILILNRVSSHYVPSGKYADRPDISKLANARKQELEKKNGDRSGANKKSQQVS